MKDLLIKILTRLGWYKKPPVIIYSTPEVKITKKGKKKYTNKVHKCPVVHKICHTEQEAKLRAKSNVGYIMLRAYKCEFCPSWHVTHKKNKLTFH